jgi:hypothetical protein
VLESCVSNTLVDVEACFYSDSLPKRSETVSDQNVDINSVKEVHHSQGEG